MFGKAPPQGPSKFGIWEVVWPNRPFTLNPTCSAIDGLRIRKRAGIDIARQGKHKLVGRRRAEYMREVRHDLLRGRGRDNIRGIRQGPRWGPPDADGMLIVFDLAGVGDRQLCIITDGIIHFAGGFPAVLRNGTDVLEIIPAVGGRRSDVRRRDHVQDAGDVRVVARTASLLLVPVGRPYADE